MSREADRNRKGATKEMLRKGGKCEIWKAELTWIRHAAAMRWIVLIPHQNMLKDHFCDAKSFFIGKNDSWLM